MTKIQQCSYACDRAGCDNESPPETNFTEARKVAEADGWFIRPSESKPEHICAACIDSVLGGGPAKEAKA
jgi:hypothetical protein